MRRLLLVAVLVLAGCAYPHTRVYLPDPSLKSDETLGYRTERSRHDIRLVEGKAILSEHWTEAAFPFGQLRHSKWLNGSYPFTSDVWFPFGTPEVKGDTCGFQTYNGVKLEGGKLKEFRANGWTFLPAEFHPIEQNAFRRKCDLDVTPEDTNQAGY